MQLSGRDFNAQSRYLQNQLPYYRTSARSFSSREFIPPSSEEAIAQGIACRDVHSGRPALLSAMVKLRHFCSNQERRRAELQPAIYVTIARRRAEEWEKKAHVGATSADVLMTGTATQLRLVVTLSRRGLLMAARNFGEGASEGRNAQRPKAMS